MTLYMYSVIFDDFNGICIFSEKYLLGGTFVDFNVTHLLASVKVISKF